MALRKSVVIARKILVTDRARAAIAEYLEVARREDWFPHGRLKGPLWIATEHRGTLQRLSQRTTKLADWAKAPLDKWAAAYGRVISGEPLQFPS